VLILKKCPMKRSECKFPTAKQVLPTPTAPPISQPKYPPQKMNIYPLSPSNTPTNPISKSPVDV
jgi:hypothetical protein